MASDIMVALKSTGSLKSGQIEKDSKSNIDSCSSLFGQALTQAAGVAYAADRQAQTANSQGSGQALAQAAGAAYAAESQAQTANSRDSGQALAQAAGAAYAAESQAQTANSWNSAAAMENVPEGARGTYTVCRPGAEATSAVTLEEGQNPETETVLRNTSAQNQPGQTAGMQAASNKADGGQALAARNAQTSEGKVQQVSTAGTVEQTKTATAAAAPGNQKMTGIQPQQAEAEQAQAILAAGAAEEAGASPAAAATAAAPEKSQIWEGRPQPTSQGEQTQRNPMAGAAGQIPGALATGAAGAADLPGNPQMATIQPQQAQEGEPIQGNPMAGAAGQIPGALATGAAEAADLPGNLQMATVQPQQAQEGEPAQGNPMAGLAGQIPGALATGAAEAADLPGDIPMAGIPGIWPQQEGEQAQGILEAGTAGQIPEALAIGAEGRAASPGDFQMAGIQPQQEGEPAQGNPMAEAGEQIGTAAITTATGAAAPPGNRQMLRGEPQSLSTAEDGVRREMAWNSQVREGQAQEISPAENGEQIGTSAAAAAPGTAAPPGNQQTPQGQPREIPAAEDVQEALPTQQTVLSSGTPDTEAASVSSVEAGVQAAAQKGISRYARDAAGAREPGTADNGAEIGEVSGQDPLAPVQSRDKGEAAGWMASSQQNGTAQAAFQKESGESKKSFQIGEEGAGDQVSLVDYYLTRTYQGATDRAVYYAEGEVADSGDLEAEYGDLLQNMIAEQIVKGKNEIEIRLFPENLGKLVVKIAYAAEGTTVSIVCSSEKTMYAMSQRASELGKILEDSLGGRTEIVVDSREQPQAQLYEDGRNGAGAQAQREQQERRQEESRRQRQKEARQADFLQQLRLGLA